MEVLRLFLPELYEEYPEVVPSVEGVGRELLPVLGVLRPEVHVVRCRPLTSTTSVAVQNVELVVPVTDHGSAWFTHPTDGQESGPLSRRPDAPPRRVGHSPATPVRHPVPVTTHPVLGDPGVDYCTERDLGTPPGVQSSKDSKRLV